MSADAGSRSVSDERQPSVGGQPKKTPNDFIFGKVIGEGSFSTVYLAKEISTGTEMAVKVLDKKHIIRERKSQYVMREKEILMKINHPSFIRLYYTFQDADRLYFVLNYARRGELLDYLRKLSSFDEDCSRFYAAEIVNALEYLHGVGIIHRDMKPENILFNDEMHIQITDFGSAKLIKKTTDDASSGDTAASESHRKNSFVGTAQYVSPEVLTSKKAYFSSDLWALGCIIYQFLSGDYPFRGGNIPPPTTTLWALGCIIYQFLSGDYPFRGRHEYQIFQKITNLEYEFPDGFSSVAQNLVEQLLIIDPTKRIGCEDLGGYGKLKAHAFFKGINWTNMDTQKPPELVPYLPATTSNPEQCWSKQRPGLDDARIGEMITENVISEEERKRRIDEQMKNNEYHKFVESNLILKQGFIFKRKGLFARKRMFLLTEGPHLYYVDPKEKVLKGQIPWSKDMRPEQKNFKIFFIHTPNRTYYLEDPKSHAEDWCTEIKQVWSHYFS